MPNRVTSCSDAVVILSLDQKVGGGPAGACDLWANAGMGGLQHVVRQLRPMGLIAA